MEPVIAAFHIPAMTRTSCAIFDGNKVSALEIPYEATGMPICAAILKTQDHSYAEDFAANPVSGCFGWMECKLE
jgi:hypothetical protein